MEAERSLLCFPDSIDWKEEGFKQGNNGEDNQLRVVRGSPLYNPELKGV